MIYKIRVWCGVVDQDNNIIQIIDFFKSYSKYENIADYDLFNYLYPCIRVSQFEVFIDREGIQGFVSWAYLNDIAEFKFKRTGEIDQWNCGDKVWVVDVLSKRNAKNEIYWLKKYFSNKFGAKKRINYLRVSSNNIIESVRHLYTQEFYK